MYIVSIILSIGLCMQLIKIHALARAASRRNSLYLRVIWSNKVHLRVIHLIYFLYHCKILPDSIPCHRHQPLDSIQLLPNGCPNRPSASLQQTLTLQHVCHYRKHRNPCQSWKWMTRDHCSRGFLRRKSGHLQIWLRKQRHSKAKDASLQWLPFFWRKLTRTKWNVTCLLKKLQMVKRIHPKEICLCNSKETKDKIWS